LHKLLVRALAEQLRAPADAAAPGRARADVLDACLRRLRLARAGLARDEDRLLLLLTEHAAVRILAQPVHVRRQVRERLGVGLLAAPGHLVRVDARDLLERVDGEQDRARGRVYLVAAVARAEVVEQRRLGEIGELDHVLRPLQRERVRLDDVGDVLCRHSSAAASRERPDGELGAGAEARA